MPIYETNKDRRNQQGVFEELRPLLGIQHFLELPRLNIYDYKIWIGTTWVKPKKQRTKAQCEKAFLEIKCYNAWLGQYGSKTFCREEKFLRAKKQPEGVGVLYAVRYWDALFVWDLKTVVPTARLAQPRRDRPENDWVVQLDQRDAVHQWWTTLI